MRDFQSLVCFIGTHCAGIAAGYQHGVAKDAHVVPVKVLDAQGVGTLASVLSGFSWVMDDILQHGFPSVLSLSLASARSESVNQAMKRFYEAGMLLLITKSISCLVLILI